MLTSTARFHSSTGSSQNGAIVIFENMAALLMSTSMRPSSESVVSAIRVAESRSATSVWTASARPCLARTSSATRSPASPSISAITGTAPWAAK